MERVRTPLALFLFSPSPYFHPSPALRERGKKKSRRWFSNLPPPLIKNDGKFGNKYFYVKIKFERRTEMLKKFLVEFIGTFFLIFTVGCTVFSEGEGVIPAIAIGFILMVMVYAGGHVSGAHYNPAVSLAAAIRGALNPKDIIPYWIAQILGGVLAAFAIISVVPVPDGAGADFNLIALLICEFLFTFALCYVVLHTATSKDTEGNSYYGLAIGATVTAGAFATAGVCLGAFNPAVAVGLLTLGAACTKVVCITILANLAGGLAAGLVYKITSND